MTGRSDSRRWLAFPGALLLASMSLSGPARAAVTLAEGAHGKLDAEIRLMFWGVWDGRDVVPSGATSQDENLEDFFLRRGRIVIRGETSDKLQIYLQFGQDNAGAKVATDDGSMRIKDFFLNYKFGEAFQTTFGQFKVPFLRQNLESGSNQLLVDRAVLAGVRPAKEGSRDLGMMGWGNVGGFQYRVGLFDGSDQEAKNPDSSLRRAARFSYNWFTPEPGIGYTGTWIGEKRVLQIGAQFDAQPDRLDPKDDAAFVLLPRDYRAWSADLFYDQPFHGKWAVTAEGAWIDRRDDYRDAGVDTRLVAGYYAQGGLLLPWAIGQGRLQGLVRYERQNTDRGSSSRSATSRTVGASYFLKGHDRKIQLDYTKKTESPVEIDNDELRLSVAVIF